MLEATPESPNKQVSKRFALKKDMPILKQFRKIHKHYNQKLHPFQMQKEEKEQLAKAQLEIEQLTSSLRAFENLNDENLENNIKKSINEESLLSPQSQNTLMERQTCKVQDELLDINQLYQSYLEQQFTEDKKLRCLEWLTKI